MSIRKCILHAALPAGAVLLMFLPVVPAAQACGGTSTITCCGQAWVYGVPAVAKSATCGQSPQPSFNGHADASFDAAQGLVSAHASTWGIEASSSAATDDEFLVRGSGSDPVTIHAVFTVGGAYYGVAHGAALVGQGSSNQHSANLNEIARDAWLHLDIQTAVGQIFPVHYEVSAAADNGGDEVGLTGTLTFVNLPTGVSVTSCRYLATPVRANCWAASGRSTDRGTG